VALLVAVGVVAAAACNGGTLGGPAGPSGGSSFDPPVLSSLDDEIPVLQPRLDALTAALAGKDPAAAAATFTPETQERYQAFFQANVQNLPTLGAALEAGELTLVGETEIASPDGTTRRVGDLAVTYDGIVFHVVVIKVDGTWMFDSM